MLGSQKGFEGIDDNSDRRDGVADRRPILEPLAGNTVFAPVDHQNHHDHVETGADQRPVNDFAGEAGQSVHRSISLKDAILDVLWMVSHDRFMIFTGGILFGVLFGVWIVQAALADLANDQQAVEFCRQVLNQ